MLKTIEAVNSAVNNFIWGIPAMVCIIGVGLYLSFRTGFIQIRKFPYSIKNTLGRIFDKSEAADGSIAVTIVLTCVAFPVPNTVRTPKREKRKASQCQCLESPFLI